MASDIRNIFEVRFQVCIFSYFSDSSKSEKCNVTGYNIKVN